MTLAITIETKALDQFSEVLKSIGRDLPATVDRAVAMTAAEGTRTIVEKTPKITGNLKRGFQMTRLAPMVWRIFNFVEYFMFIETGKRRDPRSGKTVRRRVGPALMMTSSADAIKKNLDKNVGMAVRELLGRKS